MSGTAENDWREGLVPEVVLQIEGAIQQYDADVAYEQEAQSVLSSIRLLQVLSECAEGFERSIDCLSPVAQAILFDVNNSLKADAPGDLEAISILERLSLRNLATVASRLSRVAAEAQERIPELHSPGSDIEGRGSGSARGREPDLRVIPPKPEKVRGLRSPKDKFAVAVIAALASHHCPMPLEGRGSKQAIAKFLQSVWQANGRPSENWNRAIEQRTAIIAWAKRHASSTLFEKTTFGGISVL